MNPFPTKISEQATLQNLWCKKVTVHCYLRMSTDNCHYNEVKRISSYIPNHSNLNVSLRTSQKVFITSLLCILYCNNHWYTNLDNFDPIILFTPDTVEPQYDKPPCNKVLGIMNDTFTPVISCKIYRKEPRNNKTLFWQTYFVKPSVHRYVEVLLYIGDLKKD